MLLNSVQDKFMSHEKMKTTNQTGETNVFVMARSQSSLLLPKRYPQSCGTAFFFWSNSTYQVI